MLKRLLKNRRHSTCLSLSLIVFRPLLFLFPKLAERQEEYTPRSHLVYAEDIEQARQARKYWKQTETVIALIAATVAEKILESTHLDEQKHDLAQALDRMEVTSTRVEDAICHDEKICGPLAIHALDDKVEEVLQLRFDRLVKVWITCTR
jgi:hypothetical protein